VLDNDGISAALEAAANEDVARTRRREIQCIRGIRGVPPGAIAKVAHQAWAAGGLSLETDESALQSLFATSWEDGLVTIGLLAAIVPDDPEGALDLGRELALRTDDHLTADALGWLVVGPAILAADAETYPSLRPLLAHARGPVRRAAVMSGMAWLPALIEGPSAAPLRARFRVPALRFVDVPQRGRVVDLAERVARDEDPGVRKAVRRFLATWAEHDPEGSLRFVKEFRGGIAKMLREAVEKASRKGKKRQERAEVEE
jgi:hypothetical protein